MNIKIRYYTSILIFSAFVVMNSSSAFAVEIQWFGQSAFKITTPGGKVILIDPFISKNPKTPEALKDLSKLKQVDLILVTHGHGDHVGDTARISKDYGARVAMHYGTFGLLKGTPEQLKQSLADFPADVIVMQPGDVRIF